MQTSGVNRHSKQLRNDKSNFPCSLCDLTPISSLQPSQFLWCSLKCSIPLSPPSPAPLVCFPIFFGYSFCLFLSLCSTESNSGWPSPTGLCWCPTLRRWSVSPLSFLSLSLPPSVPFPLPSPFLFVTSVDTLTGRDSQTSQFPHGLGYFALGLQKDFQFTRLYTSPQK